MELDELAREGEAEPGSLGLPAVARLLELLEDRVEVFRGDSGAGVRDGDLDAAVVEVGRDVDPALRRGELHGVREEVEDDLAHAALVGGDRDLLWLRRQPQMDAAAAGPLGVHRDGAAEDVGDLDLRELEVHPAGLDLR